MTMTHSSDLDIRSLGVVGAGLMGTGIAEVAVLSGLPTVLVRGTGRAPEEARGRVERSLERRIARGSLEREQAGAALARLTVTGDRDALAAVDIVIESIVEDLEEKRALFLDLARRAVGGVLASNTSTLCLRDLAGPGYDDRLVGMHFFSPVPAMSLVEVAHLPGTRPDVERACRRLVERLGKTPVSVVDSAGFVVNRLLVPYLIGAVAAFAQGLAGQIEIDTAMKLGCGHPMGPLALCDLIGLDVVFAMAKLLHKEFGDQRYQPPALLRRMVQDGQLGRKAGLGFYDYRAGTPVPSAGLWELVSGQLGDAGAGAGGVGRAGHDVGIIGGEVARAG
ncbi:MAG TPA: 3-hydroxyacyl-CoA dehydrogenase NAD-binding domain-containing protein [Kofleriaceae bacterium]|nr:3-hydroxyacyl-CoA dehydrogenase NAD-binding domain-containing protein [Kofleriaceae bacterium]